MRDVIITRCKENTIVVFKEWRKNTLHMFLRRANIRFEKIIII